MKKTVLMILVVFLMMGGNVFAGDLTVDGTLTTTDAVVNGKLKTRHLMPGLGIAGEPYRYMRFSDGTTSWGGFMWNDTGTAYGDGDDFTIYTYDNRDLTFYTGTGNVLIFPASGGNVGIGTKTPQAMLDIDGDLVASGRIRGTITPGGYDDKTFIGLTGNKIFNADLRPGFTVTQSGSCTLALSRLFDGDLTPGATPCGPSVADPTVITVEYPEEHTQGFAAVGWVSRYWNPVDFTIEMYDYGTATWSTVVDEQGYDNDSYSNLVWGMFSKMRFTVTKASGTDGRLQLSELFLLYREEPRFGGAYASLRGDTFYGPVNIEAGLGVNGNITSQNSIVGDSIVGTTLQSNGNIQLFSPDSGNYYISLQRTNVDNITHMWRLLHMGDGYHENELQIAEYKTGSDGLMCGSATDGICDVRMTIEGGNVGIGTTNPAKTLDVAGDAKVSGTIEIAGVCFAPKQLVTCTINGANMYVDTASDCAAAGGTEVGPISILAQCP